ncbi:MAG: hypothetical protein J2P48_07445 [Alphaproteobacteria bacterium]|nr:hypothetical protein [Alphaproteobacteria bacterium]
MRISNLGTRHDDSRCAVGRFEQQRQHRSVAVWDTKYTDEIAIQRHNHRVGAGQTLTFIQPFSIYLDWLPFVFRTDIAATEQEPMPVAMLGLLQAASWTRYVRASVVALAVIRRDYVTIARAKRLPGAYRRGQARRPQCP